MSIFKRRTFTWWQVGIVKLSPLSIGIGIGASLNAFFLPYVVPLILLGVVFGVYSAYIWFR